MLTHHDRTVDDPLSVYEELRGTGLRYVGFKDIGAPVPVLRNICVKAQNDGLKVMLEVVSTSRDEELRSVAAAAEIGVDWVLGGTHPIDGCRVLAGSSARYCPFPGTVTGHPSVLTGEIAEIADSAGQITALPGVSGLDLLAYRHPTADAAELTRAVVQASSGPVIAAGSVASVAQIEAIDQGSSSSRCMVLDGELRPLAQASCPVASSFPAPGWVEHDPREILRSVVDSVGCALGRAGAGWPDIAGIGLAAQTETFVVWERATGTPVYPAISWRDARGADCRERLRAAGHEELIRRRTGLPLEAAFSAPKIGWVLDEVPGARAAAEAGRLLFGDVNCWLTWNLSGGASHVTEPSMAARTMLLDASALGWATELLGLFGIPAPMLPAVAPTAGRLAVTDPDAAGGRAV